MHLSKPLTLVGLLALSLLILCTSAKAQEIPAGVNYKRATDAINDKAKSILEAALAAQPEKANFDTIFADAVVCGPLLWEVLKGHASKELLGANPTLIVIGAAKPVSKEATRLITAGQKKEFWQLFAEEIKKDNSFKVRKATAPEIQYYWATIPFDIEEPFYIIDFGQQKVLAHFMVKNGEPKIFWMDIVGDLATIK